MYHADRLLQIIGRMGITLCRLAQCQWSVVRLRGQGGHFNVHIVDDKHYAMA
jgi:hypothetical protein